MLTKKAQYAFRALTVLARRQKATAGGEGKEWLSAREISELAPMSVKFLEQILVELRSGGVVKSRRGPMGGHALSRPADEIKLAAVMRMMDGPIAPLACVSLHYYERCEDCVEEDCGLHRMMSEVRDAQLGVLEHRTLADLIYPT
ncbi:MAG: Rrf2 family transcriptional regulator [Flavobacteriales bacterium]|nr:Rrf2 family transcriptional regulator [Flavobacteriales bacterium]